MQARHRQGVLGTLKSGSPASVGLVEATAPSCSCLVPVCPVAYSASFSSLFPLSVPSRCSLSLWYPLRLPAGLCIRFSTCAVPSAVATRSRDRCVTSRMLPIPSAPQSAGRACAGAAAPARPAGGAVEQPRASCGHSPAPPSGWAPEGGPARAQTPKGFWSSSLMRSQKVSP